MLYPHLKLISPILDTLVIFNIVDIACLVGSLYIFAQPLYHKRMWHKANFFSEVQLLWNQSFPSHKLVVIPKLKTSVYSTALHNWE